MPDPTLQPVDFITELNEDARSQYQMLQQLAIEIQPKSILEIGSGWGVSACAFLTGSPEAKITTIDPIANLPEFDRRVKWLGLESRVTRITGRSGNPPSDKYKKDNNFVLDGIKDKFDLIFVDGSHHYEDVSYDLEHILDKCHDKTHIIVDDFYHRYNFTGNYGVNRAVCEFSNKQGLNFMVLKGGHGIAHLSF